MFFVHFLYDLIFMQNLYPHLTAIQRTKLSFPSRILHERKLLKGQVLDFGCGFGKDTELLQQQGVNIQGYDPYYQPIYPQQKFDTVLSNYVLNVLDKVAQTQVLIQISNLLQPQGIAYFAVRRDLQKEGYRWHYKHHKYTYQTQVVLPFTSIFRNDFCELYAYQNNRSFLVDLHQIKADSVRNYYEAICCFAIEDTDGQFHIYPKNKSTNVQDLSNREQQSMAIMHQFIHS